MPPKAIGQRAIAQKSSNAPPRCALLAIASPSGPPKTIRRKSAAKAKPLASTRTIDVRRTFQNGLVSIRSYAVFTALITEFIAPLAAHTAPKAPSTTAKAEPDPWALFCAVSIASMTAPGAMTPRNSSRSS
jgi:hypothetical protein